MTKFQLLLFICLTQFVFSQIPEKATTPQEKDSVKVFIPTINDYQYWTEKISRRSIDTTFHIEDFYVISQYNYKNDFGKIPFSNIGQVYNPSIFTSNSSNELILLPLGKTARFIDIEEVRYFNVKTPTTEFRYNNGMKEGHSLSVLFTQSINSQLNYMVNYQGLRSLGKYLYQLSSNNNFLITTNYHTKNNRYKFMAHVLYSNFDNEENGGIKDITNFSSGDTNYNNRQVIVTNLVNADTEYNYRRYYLNQEFGLIKSKKSDSLNQRYVISLQDKFYYESTHYTYTDTNINKFFGIDTIGTNRSDFKYYNKLSNVISAVFNWNNRLKLDAGLKTQSINYYLPHYINDSRINYIPNEIKDYRVGVVSNLDFDWKEALKIKGYGEWTKGDKFNDAYLISGTIFYEPIKNYSITGNVSYSSRNPPINMLMNQSYYKQFNYYTSEYKNTNTLTAEGNIKLKWFKTEVGVRYYRIENFSIIDSANGTYHMKQFPDPFNVLQFSLKNLWTYKKFNLNYNAFYQKRTDDGVFPYPEFIFRGTLYYQAPIFKNAATIQTGINFNYWTKFASRKFVPVLNEFSGQNPNDRYEIGAYPMFDIFFNFKVKRMKIILEGQNINSIWTKESEYWSAPDQPAVDFRLNIGILWYLFT